MTKYKMTTISELVMSLETASLVYHNGDTLTMTDDAYDTAIELLRQQVPNHPFLTKIGAPIPMKRDAILLPIPMPSLNKIKTDDEIVTWTTRCVAPIYYISVKLDGCSALWCPTMNKLFTRGDGLRGRDISGFIPFIKGLPSREGNGKGKVDDIIVRGELIMRIDCVPAGKLARNIVAGVINSPTPDRPMLGHVRFIAYELIKPHSLAPSDADSLLLANGYETAHTISIPRDQMTSHILSTLFTNMEKSSHYSIDGIVIAPNCKRAQIVSSTSNPMDRVAWKTRTTTNTARTIVRQIEWNISPSGYLIPRVLFDTVALSGSNISAATGLHGRWIYDNNVGPGAEIEVRRSGEVIPQIVAVHIPAPVGSGMPPQYKWIGETGTSIHIMPVGDEHADASACVCLTKALNELGVENVGPGIVAKLFAAGFTNIRELYSATVEDFMRADGIQKKGAERIYTGLRVKKDAWTELNFMIASCIMPRGIGHTKLAPLLTINPHPEEWCSKILKDSHPAGLSSASIDAILDRIPDYLKWKTDMGLVPLCPSPCPSPCSVTNMNVVFTGVRDKQLETTLIARGHVVSDSVTKKTTHVIHADGADVNTVKIKKAMEYGSIIIPISKFKLVNLN